MNKIICFLLVLLLINGCQVTDSNIPKEAQEYYILGNKCEKDGNLEEAAKNYEIAISVYYDYKDAHKKIYEIYKDDNGINATEEHIEEHLKKSI